MSSEVRVALIGLDTSHTIQFAMRAMDPNCAQEQKVTGMKVTSCLRFETPFQNAQGLDDRQKQLEGWGIPVTLDFDEAVAGCDAIMLTINDPAYHLPYFVKCAGLGKPVYLDKPFADTAANGKAVCKLAAENGVRMFSCSSLRFAPGLIEASAVVPEPKQASIYGALGTAPAGSSIVWYGCHAFEMLERAMGQGAKSVHAVPSPCGVVAVVSYESGAQGVVELIRDCYSYGGSLRARGAEAHYTVDSSRLYHDQLQLIVDFFHGADAPLTLDESMEVMAMLDAAQRSVDSGRAVRL